jgi:hypothetical protein
MGNFIRYSIILLLPAVILFKSCDDAGLLPTHTPAGIITFTQQNHLITLTPAVDNYMYNLWIFLADSSWKYYYSKLGNFNVTSNGSLVDASGNPVELSINPDDTVNLSRALYCIVTIDEGFVVTPGPTRILGGAFSIYNDSVSAVLTFTDTLALGSVANALSGPNSVFYFVNTPTNNGADCQKGIWFGDTNGTPSWPAGSSLNPGSGWQYKGWLYNRATNEYFTTGKFYSPFETDLDGAGPCAGSLGAPYNIPGQDWVVTGCSNVDNILNGNYEIFVVLEPENRPASLPPFVFKLYWQNQIVTSLLCLRRDNMFLQRVNFPKARIRITR